MHGWRCLRCRRRLRAAPNERQTCQSISNPYSRSYVLCTLHMRDSMACCPECPEMRAQQDGVQVQQAPVAISFQASRPPGIQASRPPDGADSPASMSSRLRKYIQTVVEAAIIRRIAGCRADADDGPAAFQSLRCTILICPRLPQTP